MRDKMRLCVVIAINPMEPNSPLDYHRGQHNRGLLPAPSDALIIFAPDRWLKRDGTVLHLPVKQDYPVALDLHH